MDNNIPLSTKIREVGMVVSHEPKKYYRFYDSLYADRIPLIEEFYSIKKTPKGIWIVPDWDFQLSYDRKEFYYTGEYKKFILDKAMKKYEKALEYFGAWIDKTCMDAENRYRVFREDGILYRSWTDGVKKLEEAI